MKQRFLKYALSLYSILKQLRAKGLVTAFTSDAGFSQLIKPLGERPFILSAHPGDDVMALGGTMAAYGKAKIPVTVLTFTAGLRGTNTGRASRTLGPRRRKEQLASYESIGGSIKPVFWNLEEKFEVDDQLIIQLVDLIDELNPDIMYVPSFLDNHPDTQAISRALRAALLKLPSTRLKAMTVAQYELWSPLIPNKILNIDEYEQSKKNAIECHESQLLCRDYLGAMLGLAHYRAAILGAGSCAEAYFVCSAKQYCNFGPQSGTEVLEMVVD